MLSQGNAIERYFIKTQGEITAYRHQDKWYARGFNAIIAANFSVIFPTFPEASGTFYDYHRWTPILTDFQTTKLLNSL